MIYFTLRIRLSHCYFNEGLSCKHGDLKVDVPTKEQMGMFFWDFQMHKIQNGFKLEILTPEATRIHRSGITL